MQRSGSEANSNSSIYIKPYLKWAGGKRQLLAEIRKHLPKNIDAYTYYEPFIGAGALFFDLKPKRAVINDSNTQLILTYRTVRDSVEDLILLLQEYEKKNSKDFFYEIRNADRDEKKFNEATDIEKTARLIFLNKTCFNGLYRVNSRGLFNVPYGKNKNPSICEATVLRCISEYLRTSEITILNCDFEQAVITANNESFIYFDPPYHSPGNTNFSAYQANVFGENEQERLRNTMIEMTNRGIKCLLSNSDTEYIREIYRFDFFDILPVQAKRAINSNSQGRGFVNELLIRNWKG